MDPVALARLVDQRADERAAQAHSGRIAAVKVVGLVLGILITLTSAVLGVGGWWSGRIKAEVERAAGSASRAERLAIVETGLADVERVMVLERIERAHEETMLGMILTGQGQAVPAKPKEVVEAAAEIDAILSK